MPTEKQFRYTSAYVPAIGTDYVVGNDGVAQIGISPSSTPGFYVLGVTYDDGDTFYYFVSPATLVLGAALEEVEAKPDLVVARHRLTDLQEIES